MTTAAAPAAAPASAAVQTHEVPLMVRKAMRWFGLGDQDVAVLVQVMKNRLADLRAYMLGGTLSDGTDVPGQKAVLESNVQLQHKVLELAERLDELLKQQTKSEIKPEEP